MFLARLLLGSSPEEIPFWKDFTIIVSASSIDNKGNKKVLFNRCVAYFGKEDNGNFLLILDSRDTKEDLFTFPILANWKPIIEIKPDSVCYEVNVSEEITLIIKIRTEKEDYDDSSQLRQILARLIYQVKTNKSYKTCSNFEEEMNKIIPIKDSPSKAMVFSKEIILAEEKIKSNPKVRFSSVGRFASLNPNVKDQVNVIVDEGIITIESRGGFNYFLCVLDKKGQEQFQRKLDENFYHYIDKKNNGISWTEPKSGSLLLLNFSSLNDKFCEIEDTITKAIFESSRNMKFEEAAEKEGNNWDQYYLQQEPTDKEIEEEFQRYKKRLQTVEYTEKPRVFKIPESGDKLGFRNLVQAKSLGLCLAGRAEGIDIFRLKRNGKELNLEHSETLRGIKSSNGKQIVASKLQIQEADTKIVMNDESNPFAIIYSDLSRGKVVSEWKPTGSAIKDIALNSGKQQSLQPDPVFLALSEQAIVRVDPRTQKGVVAEHKYKSNYHFDKILGVAGKGTLVTSNGGDIRFFGDLQSNAKNLIPSKYGQSALMLDHSKDGNLLLLTYPTMILLMPTETKEGSAFGKTFKKDRKPRLLELSVNPQAMVRHGISKLDFISAKFDEKENELENYIVAVTGQFIVLWVLSDVAKGKYLTSYVKRMDDTVVAGEFMYNQDDLLAAFRKNLTVQELRTDKF